ncbi:AAA family ATPase [Planctopirus hydrillae]|uniref:AAA+ ATPase domain-containing protein n=1 Tax=Planctopirus hydrillae TaxID=1841610 RepID=A0A1C3ENY5_9PLAN|nr:AAA family ATPase [Planctopirus hydrillae]ODA34947.1 hypothetical protein A6X21_04735 [Planctopirus hydrillae]
MNTFPKITLDELEGLLQGKRGSARCPAHEDRNASLSYSEGRDGRLVMKCHAGCEFKDIAASLGLHPSQFMPESELHDSRRVTSKARRTSSKPSGKGFATADEAIVASSRQFGRQPDHQWEYHDANGQIVGHILRWNQSEGKDIRPISLIDGRWYPNGMPEPRPLFGLPEVLNSSSVVWITEGEKAADSLRSIGFVATTSAGGCKAVNKTDWSALAGRSVVLWPDHDDPGELFVAEVADILQAIEPAATVKIVRPFDGDPEAAKGDDAFDWIERRDAALPDDLRGQLEALAAVTSPEKRKSDDRPLMLEVHRASDIETRETTWLWPGRIPAGKLSLLVGDPGLGKSLLTADMAARLTRGNGWPDGQAMGESCEVAFVLFEDSFGDTTKPRLLKAGADCQKVLWIEGRTSIDAEGRKVVQSFDATRDVPELVKLVEQNPGIRLLIVDPLLAGLGKTDSHKYGDVQGALNALVQFAEAYNVAVIGIGHLNKGTGGKSIYRSMGSLAFTAKARAVWHLGAMKDDPQRRLFLPAKFNLGPMPEGLAFTVVDGMLHWEADGIGMNADALLEDEASNRSSVPDLSVDDFLKAVLADGPKPASEVLDEAKQEGIPPKRTRRSFKELGGKRRKLGNGPWLWSLSGQDDQHSPRCPTLEPGVLGILGESCSPAVDAEQTSELLP